MFLSGAVTTENNSKRLKRTKRDNPLILNIFTQGCVNTQPSGLWTFPGDISKNYKKLSYWTDLAKKAEDAKLNAIFIADVLGSYDVYKGPRNYKTGLKAGVQHPGIAPDTAVTGMASVTNNLGFGLTFSTISEHPYHFARRLGSLDHLTDGRVGWNIVSSYLDSASRNLLAGQTLPEKTERYKKTEEYVQVVNELLLSSFRSDSVKADTESITYVDPELVREINFKGNYYNVPGPSYTEPSPQGIPVLFQAGISPGGMQLGAKTAEVIFLDGGSIHLLKERVDTIKKIAKEKYNRGPNSIKFLIQVTVIVGQTHEEAQKKFDRYKEYVDPEGALALVSGWTNIDFSQFDDDLDLTQLKNRSHLEIIRHFCSDIFGDGPINKERFARHVGVKGGSDLFLGSIKEVADKLEEWVESTGIDGFNFASATNPGDFDDLIDFVIPELRRRGLAWDDYPVKNGTFRENLYGLKDQKFLPDEHPYHQYRWVKGTNEEFTKQLNSYKNDLFRRQGNSNK